ncbi:protein of unknown function [Methylacidimicrobium sp. AP8]|nr:protein of unknown function [Methylacidimicrobium sp. AP8]
MPLRLRRRRRNRRRPSCRLLRLRPEGGAGSNSLQARNRRTEQPARREAAHFARGSRKPKARSTLGIFDGTRATPGAARAQFDEDGAPAAPAPARRPYFQP